MRGPPGSTQSALYGSRFASRTAAFAAIRPLKYKISVRCFFSCGLLNGTGIDTGGLLTVDTGETAATLTVRARSGYDTNKSGTATVTVKDPLVFIGGQDYESLEEAVAAAAGRTETITIKGNISTGSITVTAANTQITLQSDSATERVITGTSNNRFSFGGSGSKLTLDANITLSGEGVDVNSGAELILNGAKITGASGNGVYVSTGGTFTMQDGSIENNMASGVQVRNGATFIMQGGSIKNNTARFGGGVYNLGSFTMQGSSIINDNETPDSGGGVFLEFWSIFSKNVGTTICGNNAGGDSNTVDSYSNGAAIYVSTSPG
jgi:hypothetical protein